MTEDLFQKFIDGHCGIQERAEVEHWLDTCSEEELDQLLKKKWNGETAAMPDLMAQRLWNNLNEEIIKQQHPVRQFPSSGFTRWLAAACFAAAIITGYVFFTKTRGNAVDTSVAGGASITEKQTRWIIVKNDDTGTKTVVLPDSSRVTLYQNAAIRFPKIFTTTERPVSLIGKAVFAVAKDKSRPFTVYSNDIATTAVGTRFLVNYDLRSQHIDIRLLEGVIRVGTTTDLSASKSKLLYPGDEIHFGYQDTRENVVIHHEPPDNRQAITRLPEKPENEINFSNTPLPDVFRQMEKLYHISIEYQIGELINMSLTSTISRTDDPESFLQMIGRMNGLDVTKTDSSFIISKRSQQKENN